MRTWPQQRPLRPFRFLWSLLKAIVPALLLGALLGILLGSCSRKTVKAATDTRTATVSVADRGSSVLAAQVREVHDTVVAWNDRVVTVTQAGDTVREVRTVYRDKVRWRTDTALLVVHDTVRVLQADTVRVASKAMESKTPWYADYFKLLPVLAVGLTLLAGLGVWLAKR